MSWQWNNPLKNSTIHASRCHYCNVDFVCFHIVTCYTNPLLSHIHVNTTILRNITCTSVVTCTILGRLECISWPPYQGCFLHPHNPIWQSVMVIGVTWLVQRLWAKPFTLSLDKSLPKCTSLDIWNYGIHVNILSSWSAIEVCLELHASTFALVFENYNLPSMYIYIYSHVFACYSVASGLPFQSPLIYQHCSIFEALTIYWCQYLGSTQQ